MLSRLSVYTLFLIGWSRYSKFRSIGGYRAISQAISYEISIIFLLVGYCWFLSSYNFFDWTLWQVGYWFILLIFPVFFCWLLICLAETNRTPFDFSEGESELVSGFNTEYGGGFFSLIFITEYASILFLRIISSVFFIGFRFLSFLKGFSVGLFYLWARGSFPRLRYDKLIIISWKGILPVTIGFILIIFFERRFF